VEIERRLPNQIQRDVGESNVFLEDGPVTAPFTEAVAEHEAVVAEPKEVLEEVGVQGCRLRIP
jgi:hypothetical protein